MVEHVSGTPRRHRCGLREDLTDEQFATLWNALLGEGKIDRTPLTAWIAKKNLLALARTGTDRHQIGHARWKFLTWCADADSQRLRKRCVATRRAHGHLRAVQL